MIRRIFKGIASLVMLAAGILFAAAFVALGFAAFLLTCKRVWGQPTKMNAGVDLIGSALRFGSVVRTVSRQDIETVARVAADLIPDSVADASDLVSE